MNLELNKNSLLYKFFHFLRYPNSEVYLRESFFNKLLLNLRLYAFLYIFIMIAGILLSFSLTLTGFETEDNLVTSFAFSESIGALLLFAIIFGPLIEELTFRLALKFSIWRLIIGLSFINYTFLSVIQNIFQNIFPDWFLNITSLQGIFSILCIFLVSNILVFTTYKLKGEAKIKESFKKHFKLIFYLSALLFGLLHLFNYTNLKEIWYLTPLLILPQLCAGIFFGYIRIRLGFIHNYVMHMLHNGLTLLPVLSLRSSNIDISSLESGLMNNSSMTIFGILGFGFCLGLTILLIINLINIAELFIRTPTH